MRTSFRLLGMPQRKKSTVTRMKGTIWPAGNKEWRAEGAVSRGKLSSGCCAIVRLLLKESSKRRESETLLCLFPDQSSCTMIFLNFRGLELQAFRIVVEGNNRADGVFDGKLAFLKHFDNGAKILWQRVARAENIEFLFDKELGFVSYGFLGVADVNDAASESGFLDRGAKGFGDTDGFDDDV